MSALAEHHLETGHHIDFDRAKTLVTEERWWRRKLWKAIEIEQKPYTVNRDSFCRVKDNPLSRSWLPVLFRATSPGNRPKDINLYTTP
jgi:hypothetical protein